MAAVTEDRTLQEEEADGGNSNVIMLMLMECTEGNVPMEENEATSPQDDTQAFDSPCQEFLFHFFLFLLFKKQIL